VAALLQAGLAVLSVTLLAAPLQAGLATLAVAETTPWARREVAGAAALKMVAGKAAQPMRSLAESEGQT